MSIRLGEPAKCAFTYGDTTAIIGDFVVTELSQNYRLINTTDTYEGPFICGANTVEVCMVSSGEVTLLENYNCRCEVMSVPIRDKKVKDCTIEELLFAVRQKI